MTQEPKQKPATCPSCTHVVLKGFNAAGPASFQTRCPHCHVPLMVSVHLEEVVEVKQVAQVTFVR